MSRPDGITSALIRIETTKLPWYTTDPFRTKVAVEMLEQTDPARLSDEAFLSAVENAMIAPQAFDHKAHVRAAFLLLKATDAFVPALLRMSDALKGITVKAGVPEKYHETITVAFMAVVHERMAAGGQRASWPAFVSGNPDLLTCNPLKTIYSAEQLASPLARRIFVLPQAMVVKQ